MVRITACNHSSGWTWRPEVDLNTNVTSSFWSNDSLFCGTKFPTLQDKWNHQLDLLSESSWMLPSSETFSYIFKKIQCPKCRSTGGTLKSVYDYTLDRVLCFTGFYSWAMLSSINLQQKVTIGSNSSTSDFGLKKSSDNNLLPSFTR